MSPSAPNRWHRRNGWTCPACAGTGIATGDYACRHCVMGRVLWLGPRIGRHGRHSTARECRAARRVEMQRERAYDRGMARYAESIAPDCRDGCGLTCGDRPCGGCLQGAPCDASPCRCDDEHDDYRDDVYTLDEDDEP